MTVTVILKASFQKCCRSSGNVHKQKTNGFWRYWSLEVTEIGLEGTWDSDMISSTETSMMLDASIDSWFPVVIRAIGRKCIKISNHMMVYKDEGMLMLLQNAVVILSEIDNWPSAQLPGNYQGALRGKRKVHDTMWGTTYAWSQPDSYIKLADNISAFKITFKNSNSSHCFVELPQNAKRRGRPNSPNFAQWLRFLTQSLKERLVL